MTFHPNIAHTEEYTIATYEIDSSKKATIPALINLMQETAMQQVLIMKVSVWDLEKHHISWVLMRLQLKINKIPQLGDRIKIVTNPSGFEKFFTYRDYRIYDDKDQLIASASSTWLMMDTIKRRMTRIPDFILDYQTPNETHPPLPRPLNKLNPFEADQFIDKPFQVNWHDLDFNEHLSNVHYIKWMLETMEDEVLKKGQLQQLDLIYRSEALWKEELISQTHQIDALNFQHRLIRKSDQKELASAQTKWKI